MSATISNGKLILTSERNGFNMGIKTLPDAPANIDMMVFAFRAYWDTYTASETVTTGWESFQCFGLSFDGLEPTLVSKSNFNGIGAYSGATNSSVSVSYGASTFGTNLPGTTIQNGAYLFLTGAIVVGGVTTSGLSFPANPTVGSLFTGLWTVRKVAGTRDAYFNLSYNMDGIPIGSLCSARISANTVVSYSDTLYSNTLWCPSISTFSPPKYVVAKFCGGALGKKLIVESVEIEYHKWGVTT